ncbi:MAG: ribonucleoside-diphosphate reductase subunit alpha [Omnitrophica WOR_2 bacterium RIFCSPHIGHO2_02_FULL_52_10]|nr:MAG: ribonucleoside-diphosphate reductase subunit alpha [Omnitrophica WOR_2 bacterium RIFCSPHIGHO2_02_FULL_52_10]
MNIHKRNGQIVAFNEIRIKRAIGNAFKEQRNLPREVELPIEVVQHVEKVTQSVVSVITERYMKKEYISVEAVQDEVIRHLFENGFKDVAELYANYRKQHAARRALFELYTLKKRDGKVVSFKPEKITLAIAKAFRAHNHDILTERLLGRVHEVSDKVVSEIRTLWPQGKCLDIEEVQDLVENNLMRAGYHEIAKSFILYREERAKIRRERLTQTAVEEASYELLKDMVFIARDGQRKQIPLKEIRFQLETCCLGLKNVSSEDILKEAVKNYFNEMSEAQMAAANIMTAKAFLEKEPDYTFVAARLLLLKEYEEAIGHPVSFEGIKTEYPGYFDHYIHRAVELELLSPDLLQFDLKMLGTHINPKRDFNFRYMGLQTLYDRYFIHWEGRRLELPQIFWMRVAMGLAKNDGPRKNERALEFYNILSTFRFTSSTPTLFNSGTRHSQLSSCFLTTIEDDLLHIFKCIQDDAMLSKWSGGLGNDWTNIRAMGSRIKGTNGKSQGIIPFLKVANDTALAVNQGGKRQGAMCAYLEVWHLDIEEFLELRKNTGDDRRRTHDMHTAAWIPDLFMKRIKENGNWTLFSPNETPDLHHIYGREFEQRYGTYEALAQNGKMRQFKVLPAIELWRKMLNMLFETGHPWITWKDPSNVRSPQDHVGTIHSSNLCTEILLNTSKSETAVCNLGSVNLAAHTTKDGLDHKKLKETVTTAVRMLDNVIDLNYYPTPEAKIANQRHRPIGLGFMGFQDALYIQNMSYASQDAVQFADESMEAISYYAILASIENAKEAGPYASYRGSKWERGLLPLDTLNTLELERGGHLDVDRSCTMDWAPVRAELKKYGIRNSLLMAIAPTATIGNIIGVTASIEPQYKNIFVKSNLSGEFTVVNEYLVHDLKELGLWDNEMIDDLKYFDGSIQEIARIPANIKQKYVTAFEIEYEWLVEAASRRQKWIDMGQSLNLYQAKPSGKKVSDMYMLAWEKGLKTTYYLRSMGATRVEKSTLDVTKYDNVVGQRQRDKFGRVVIDEPDAKLTVAPKEDCEACQ